MGRFKSLVFMHTYVYVGGPRDGQVLETSLPLYDGEVMHNIDMIPDGTGWTFYETGAYKYDGGFRLIYIDSPKA